MGAQQRLFDDERLATSSADEGRFFMCALIIRAAHDVNEGMSCTCLRDGYHRRIQNRGISFVFRYISAA